MSEEYQEKHLYTTQEKLEELGYGEWVEEADEVDFKYRDYHCKIGRSGLSGALCGYIQIPNGHPWYEKHYDNIDITVHGGLTFGGFSALIQGNKIGYLIGFDCAHSGDIAPGWVKATRILIQADPEWAENERKFQEKYQTRCRQTFQKTYRNIQFCIDECKSMVDQAIASEQLVVD